MGGGFALTGVEVHRVNNAEEGEEALDAAMENDEHGIIVLDENLMNDMDQRRINRYFERTVPLIVPLPGELVWRDVEEMSQDDYVARLIRHAVGYQLNIQL
jgi:vacuolar-type H+-ATPase subunit F/Vma7